MGVLKRVVTAWQPLVGADCARWIANAHRPIAIILVTLVISWPIGILQATVNAGAAHTALSIANGLVFPVLVCEFVTWAALLRNRRLALVRILSAAGHHVSTRPHIWSPSRFVSWCVSQRLERAAVRSATEGYFEVRNG